VRYSPTEPVSELRRIRIVECCEPLVDFLEACPRLILSEPRFNYRRETLVRESVARMLCEACEALPKGHRLGIVEGWRAPYIQRRMHASVKAFIRGQNPDWSEHKLQRMVNQLSAPMNPRVPPPHTTGGAVDLVLMDEEGRELDVCSPFDPFNHACYAFDAPGLVPKARERRMMMKEALNGAGLTNYPSEFWHWSYGDQGWAYRGGHEHALYAAVQPQNWEPAPEDDTDEPLQMLFEPQM
jgi:zinc D-Ala-D-Ala dipeptidase